VPSSTYTVTATFSVSEHSDEHLHGARVIEEEIKSWLESLNATVHRVTVGPGDPRVLPEG
jgi:hypothetical protein